MRLQAVAAGLVFLALFLLVLTRPWFRRRQYRRRTGIVLVLVAAGLWFWLFSPFAPFPRFISVGAMNRLSRGQPFRYRPTRSHDLIGWLIFLHRATWDAYPMAMESKWLWVAEVGSPMNQNRHVGLRLTGPAFQVVYRYWPYRPNLGGRYWVTLINAWGRKQNWEKGAAYGEPTSPYFHGHWLEPLPAPYWPFQAVPLGGITPEYAIDVNPASGEVYPLSTGNRIRFTLAVPPPSLPSPSGDLGRKDYTMYVTPAVHGFYSVGKDPDLLAGMRRYGVEIGRFTPADRNVFWMIPREGETRHGPLKFRPGSRYTVWAVAPDGTYCFTTVKLSPTFHLRVEPARLAARHISTISGSGLTGRRVRLMIVGKDGWQAPLGSAPLHNGAFRFRWSVPTRYRSHPISSAQMIEAVGSRHRWRLFLTSANWDYPRYPATPPWARAAAGQ